MGGGENLSPLAQILITVSRKEVEHGDVIASEKENDNERRGVMKDRKGCTRTHERTSQDALCTPPQPSFSHRSPRN